MATLHRLSRPLLIMVVVLAFIASACGDDTTLEVAEAQGGEDDAATETGTEAAETTTTAEAAETTTTAEAAETTTTATSEDAEPSETATPSPSCDETAAQFVTRGSANPDLVDPEVAATCENGQVVVVSNGVPDFTYIGTSPGVPDGRAFDFAFPDTPTTAETATPVPVIGPIGVTLSGIAIYGPTEGTGGDVDSLPGIVSACGSHNGPGGFHTHKILSSTETDCWFAPEEVAAEPQLAGYAFDGYPIYTGIDQYTSSWQLTDESLFATDTWAAHTYVEGSGDLDECNGLTDEEGNYAYYTTEAFPYVLGCFAGEVELEAAGGGDDRPEPPADGEGGEGGEGGERPERPERPEGGADDRPEPPADGEGDERPEPPAEDAADG